MRKFWLAIWLVVSFPSSVHAIDLSVKDPIVNDLEITVNASLSATSNYYLQGTLRSQSSSKYFGETQNNQGDWVDYLSSPDKEYITSNFLFTNVQDATWSGQVKIRFKIDDPNYQGPGIYDLKLRRFTGSSSSAAGDSNTLVINLTATLPSPSPSPSPTPSPTPTPTPTPSLSPSPSPTPAPIPKASPSLSPSILPLTSEQVGTVAGDSTKINLSGFGISPIPTFNPESRPGGSPTLNQSRAKIVIAIGSGLLLIALASFFAYRRYLATQQKDSPEI